MKQSTSDDCRHSTARVGRLGSVAVTKPREFSLSEGLKWAHRLRLDLAFEIQKLESGVRRVTDMTADGPIDVTGQVLASNRDRFELLEQMIEGLGSAARAD